MQFPTAARDLGECDPEDDGTIAAGSWRSMIVALLTSVLAAGSSLRDGEEALSTIKTTDWISCDDEVDCNNCEKYNPSKSPRVGCSITILL